MTPDNIITNGKWHPYDEIEANCVILINKWSPHWKTSIDKIFLRNYNCKKTGGVF